MKFWGIEVKSGQLFKVKLSPGRYLYIKQACLGEIKEEVDGPVVVQIAAEDKVTEVLTLYPRKQPLQQLYMAYKKDFQISHTLTNGSVYFIGVVTKKPRHKEDFSETDTDDDGEEEEKSSTFKCAHCCKFCNRKFKTKDEL